MLLTRLPPDARLSCSAPAGRARRLTAVAGPGLPRRAAYAAGRVG